MNVRKREQRPAPDYPSQRQFAEYKRLLGVAAIGLSAVTGWAAPASPGGVPLRTGGKPAIEPRQTKPTAATTNAAACQLEPARLLGEIAVVPAPPGAPPIVPQPANTNLQGRATYTVLKGDTLSALAARFLGNSNRWHDIAAANPGVTPATLKVGQAIVIPAKAASNITEAIRLKGDMPAPRR